MKIIPQYPNYQITPDGRVFSLISNEEMTASVGSNGYKSVTLRHDGKTYRCLVHRLVMGAYVGASDLQVNHINGDKLDNRLENLEYVTPSENVRHAFKTGLNKINTRFSAENGRTSAHKQMKAVNQHTLDGKFVAQYRGIREAQRICGHKGIGEVCRGQLSTAGGYVWRYANENEYEHGSTQGNQ